MRNHIFSGDEIEKLKKSPFVRKFTNKSITYTPEFKKLAIKQHNQCGNGGNGDSQKWGPRNAQKWKWWKWGQPPFFTFSCVVEMVEMGTATIFYLFVCHNNL